MKILYKCKLRKQNNEELVLYKNRIELIVDNKVFKTIVLNKITSITINTLRPESLSCSTIDFDIGGEYPTNFTFDTDNLFAIEELRDSIVNLL